MRLQVLLPRGVLLDEDGVDQVVAEAHHGVFALLPRHVDLVAPLVPGILLYEREGRETVLGVDEGLLVKEGPRVRVSVHDAVKGDDLDRLRALVEARYREVDERERRARTATARLEASFYRRLIEQEDLRRG